MINLIIDLTLGILGRIISILPEGPDIPVIVGTVLTDAFSFVKSLDLLINVAFEITALTAIFTWEIGKAGFKAVDWVYVRVRG